MGNEFENAMKIGGGIVLLGMLLMFGVVILPFLLIYAVFLLYKKNPMKQESDARNLNQQLYDQVVARVGGVPTEAEIQTALELELSRDIPDDLMFHFKAHARISAGLFLISGELSAVVVERSQTLPSPYPPRTSPFPSPCACPALCCHD